MTRIPEIGEMRERGLPAPPRHREDAEMMPALYAAAVWRPHRLASWALGGIGVALCLFLAAAALLPVGEIARIDGTVMPAGQTRMIAHRSGGIVDDVLVSEGDEVRPGQVLMRIENQAAQAELAEASRRLAALVARAARLGAEANGHEDIAELGADSPQVAMEREVFRARRERLAIERQGVEQRQRQHEQSLVRQDAIVERLEEKLLALRTEYGNALRGVAAGRPELPQLLKDAERELATERLALLRIQAAILETRQELTDRHDAFADEARKDLRATESEIAQLKERIETLAQDAKTSDVKSPLRGTVKRLRVAAKGVARAGEPLVEIVPYDEMLVVEGRVRPADIAYFRLGRPVRVTIAADDRAAPGGLEGSVFEISPDAIESSGTRGETYFRIKVRTKSRAEYGGKALPIAPGTPAQIALKIGETTLLAYMLKPFARSVRRVDSDDADSDMPSAESL